MAENFYQPEFQELMSVEYDISARQAFWENNAVNYNDFVKEYAPDVATFIPDFLEKFEAQSGIQISRDGNVLDVGCGTGNREVLGCCINPVHEFFTHFPKMKI